MAIPSRLLPDYTGRVGYMERPMRKECKTLHTKAVDSLVLAVDHFNRAWDRGRTEAVLILLDRAFEPF